MRKSKNFPICPVARTALILGSRWSAEILREFMLHGSRKFQDLQDGLDGIGPTTLSNRLKLFEDHGVVERRIYEEHPPRAEYVLTEKGRKMGPIFRAMKDWGEIADQ
jgi:DNA-binding HxlR family transcriptional regulator